MINLECSQQLWGIVVAGELTFWFDLRWPTFELRRQSLSPLPSKPREDACVPLVQIKSVFVLNSPCLNSLHQPLAFTASSLLFALGGTHTCVLKSWKPTQMAERLVRARPAAAAFAVRLRVPGPRFVLCGSKSASRRWHQQDVISFPANSTWSARAREQLFPDLLGKGDFGQNSDAFFFCG